MSDFVPDFLLFWFGEGPEKFIRIFWYFIFFEFTRYLLLDIIVLSIYQLNRWYNKDYYAKAKELMWADKPFISIIVPGKNEGKHIYKLVRSLREQTYQHFELIVVDDGSDDETPVIGRSLEKNGMIDLFLRNEERGGKASAANLALRYTKGKYILHLDADCSMDRTAVENAVMPFYMDDRIGAVGGNLEVRNGNDSLATVMQAIEYLKTILVGRMVTSHLGIYTIISGAFGVFRKDILDKIKGWDIGPGLDGDITVKIRKMGYKIHFEPSAIALTSVPDNFTKLAKQRMRWSKSIVRFRMRKHKNIFYPDENFSFINFLASFENIFYNVILNIKWYFYVADMMINYPHLIKYIVPMNIFMYTLSNIIQYFVILLLTDNKKEKLKLAPFVPLYVFYIGFYLRAVKTIAHLREMFFWGSYNDNWNPQKSSTQAKRLQI